MSIDIGRIRGDCQLSSIRSNLDTPVTVSQLDCLPKNHKKEERNHNLMMSNKRNSNELAISDLAVMLETLTQTVNEMRSELKGDRQYFSAKITTVESRVDIVEREVNKKSLVITGIQAPAEEEEEDLVDVVVKISKFLGSTVPKGEIDDVWRFGKEKERIKVIFLRTITKRNLLKKIRERKKLSTKELNLEGDHQIYLNEDLGKGAQEIWKKARQLKKQKLIDRVWTSEGRILYKIQEKDQPKLCISLYELYQLEAIGPQALSAQSSATQQASDNTMKPKRT